MCGTFGLLTYFSLIIFRLDLALAYSIASSNSFFTLLVPIADLMRNDDLVLLLEKSLELIYGVFSLLVLSIGVMFPRSNFGTGF